MTGVGQDEGTILRQLIHYIAGANLVLDRYFSHLLIASYEIKNGMTVPHPRCTLLLSGTSSLYRYTVQ